MLTLSEREADDGETGEPTSAVLASSPQPISSSARSLFVHLVAAHAAALIMVGALTPVAALFSEGADVALYYEVGQRLANGEVPYVDFTSEYPPLGLIPMAIARFVPSAQSVNHDAFAWRFLVFNVALSVAGLLLLAWISVRGHLRPQMLGWAGASAAGAIYLPLTILLAPLIDWRYDIFPAILTLAAFALLIAGRPALSGIALGASVAAKLYAAPLGLVFIGWHIARKEYGQAAKFATGFVAVGAAILAPFVLLGERMNLTFLRYQLDRGLQIESLPAGIVEVGHLLGLEASVRGAFGALEVVSPLTQPVLVLFGVLGPIVIGLTVALALLCLHQQERQRRLTPATLAALIAAVLLAVIVSNKVLSPQYLIWILPFVPLLTGWPRVMILVAVTLTVVIFPFLYGALRDLRPFPVVLVNIRNALLVATLAWMIIEQRPMIGAALSNVRALIERKPRALRWTRGHTPREMRCRET